MRLWSIHPKYLDQKGLVALWREALLAQKVLLNQTKGYKNHPQLNRFKEFPYPLEAISYYLWVVYDEASKNRGYRFDSTKIINPGCITRPITVTDGQVSYELDHLKQKLIIRDESRLKYLPNTKENIELHPLFTLIQGSIENWEKLY